MDRYISVAALCIADKVPPTRWFTFTPTYLHNARLSVKGYNIYTRIPTIHWYCIYIYTRLQDNHCYLLLTKQKRDVYVFPSTEAKCSCSHV